MRGKYQHQVTPYMRNGVSPERITMFARWLGDAIGRKEKFELRDILNKWQSGIYAVPLVLRDHGRPWREEHGFAKPEGNRGIRRTWVKSDSTK
jgi:hypothetical protein